MSNSIIFFAKVFNNHVNQPMVEINGKVMPYASPVRCGDPSVWWADSWEEFEDVVKVLEDSDGEVYLPIFAM